MREIISYDDVRLEVIAEGSGPLVVMLPSRGRGAEDFAGITETIAKAGFRVLRPQPRGAGQSHGPMQNLTLHDLARDIAAVIRHEGGGPAVLVGHAFGSWVARMAAVDHPKLVRGVVMVAAAGRATKQSEWWSGGTAPLLDLQGDLDPFKPRSMMNEMRQEFRERATVVVIPNASHALLPEQPAAAVDAILAWIGKLPL